MFIKNLKVENIGAFKGQKEFNFTKGSNLILGENGKGKSTIVELISLLIANTYNGNLESLINNSCSEASAELTFEHKNVEYKNIINITKKKSTTSKKELYADNKLVASGEDVEKYLSDILPKELINYSLFAKQKGEKITTVSDSDRREILAQLCELDYSSKIKDIIEPQIDFLKSEINIKEKEEYSLEHKTYNFGTEKEIENSWTDDDEKQLNEYEENQKLYEKNFELKKRISDLNYKLHDLSDDLERKKFDYDVEKLTVENEKKINELEKDHKVNLSEIEENYKHDNSKCAMLISDVEKEINLNEAKINEIKLIKLAKFNDKELIERRNQYSELVTKSKIAFKNADVLSNGICPTCGGSCNGKHDEFENEGKLFEKQSIECEGVISELENKKKEYELKKEENDKNKALKENLTIKISLLKDKLDSLKSSKDKLYHAYENNISIEEKSYSDKITSCNSLFTEKKNNAENIIKTAEKIYNDTKEELLSIENPKEDLKDYTKEIKNLEETKTKYLEDVSYNKAIRENNEKLSSEKIEDEKTLKAVKSKLDELKLSLTNYTLAKELMSKTFPNYALDRISDSLVKEINEFIETIYYKELNVKFEPNKNSLKMTYNPNGERDLPIIKLSGAETSIVDLSVISVFNNRQKLNCLIMDEVDSASSNETALKFLEALEELTNKYEQTIIISHKKELQNRLIQNGANAISL